MEKQHTISFKFLHFDKNFLHEKSETLITCSDLTDYPYEHFEELIDKTGNPASTELLSAMIFFAEYNLSDDVSISIDYNLD